MRRRQWRPAALPASGSGSNVGVISQLRTHSYHVGLSHVGAASIPRKPSDRELLERTRVGCRNAAGAVEQQLVRVARAFRAGGDPVQMSARVLHGRLRSHRWDAKRALRATKSRGALITRHLGHTVRDSRRSLRAIENSTAVTHRIIVPAAHEGVRARAAVRGRACSGAIIAAAAAAAGLCASRGAGAPPSAALERSRSARAAPHLKAWYAVSSAAPRQGPVNMATADAGT